MSGPTFEGTPEQQTLAAEIFHLMRIQGTFFSDDAPIKQTLAHLADYLSQQQQRDRDDIVQEIDTALSINNQIFRREQHDDEVVYITSRLGMFVPFEEDMSHTFAVRLYEPENPLPIDDISVVVSTSRPALTTVEPVFISDYWQEQAGLTPAPDMPEQPVSPADVYPRGDDVPDVIQPPPADMYPRGEDVPGVAQQPDGTVPAFSSIPPAPEVPMDIDAPGAVPSEIEYDDSAIPNLANTLSEMYSDQVDDVEDVTDVSYADSAGEMIEAEAEDAAGGAVLPVEDTSVADAEPMPMVSHATLTLDDGTKLDLSRSIADLMADHGEVLQQKLIEAFDRDPLRRVVRFGNMLYAESALASLGKNDLRRIRDDIIEAGEPLMDTTIIADLYHSQRQADYESFRFSLNYRLSREKDFEFVGVEGACLWSVKGLPTVGTKRIKASEMAQFTSYLVEGYDDSLEEQDRAAIEETGVITHLLTFFEWTYGVLTFDSSLQLLLPKPMLPDQRSAVLRIESPQHYTTYLAEVRYPTNNRGGWLQGLEDFFQEHLTPGAVITLERTEEPNLFAIFYEEVAETTDRILTLDEKKNKFAFQDRTYYCGIDPGLFVNQQQFGRLKNLKSLPTNDRRKSDMLLQHVFEVIGDRTGTRSEPVYQTDLEKLYVGFNVLRPASRSFLQSLLMSNDAYTVEDEELQIYSYTPEPKLLSDEDEEGEDDDMMMQWAYDDDE